MGSDSIIIGAVPTTMIELVWRKTLPHLQRVQEKAPNEIDLSKTKEALLSGSHMLLIASEGEDIIAACILRDETYVTGHRVLLVNMLGGDRMDEWVERMNRIVVAIARDTNCNEVRAIGRKGWIKALKNFGWYDIHSTVGCAVNSLEEDS